MAIGLGLVGIGLAIGAPRAVAQADPTGAQAPPVAAPEVPEGSAGPSTLDSLSIRYRLSEMYSLTPVPANPEILSQYQVATRETKKIVREQAQGTPSRDETTYQVIYTEQPAKLTNATGVTDTIRRYDAFRMQPPGHTQRLKTPFLDKLTVWYRGLPGQPPQAFSLTEGRPIREQEYGAITSQVFLPQLVMLLPATPKRVGDTWRISRNAARALLGVMPQVDEFDLSATLKEVRKGTPSTAVIAVSGKVMADYEVMPVNARLMFTFDPKATAPPADANPAANPAAAAAAREPGVVDARGSISKIAMAMARTMPIPDGDGRLQQTLTREVLVERRAVPADSPPLAVPATEPDPDSPDSWVTYDDPAGRFHFRHPQGLLLPPAGPMGPNEVTLVQDRPTGPDVLIVKLQPPVKDPARDRELLDPDHHRKHLDEEWQKQQQDVLKIPPGWLPDADWAPLKRKVYRIEAALRPKADPKAKRIYLDYYLVVFDRNQSIVVEAMTTQDPHLAFRNQAEAIIKTFDFGTSDGSPPPALNPAGTARDARPGASGRKPAAPGRSPRSTESRNETAPRTQPKAKDASEPSPFPQ
jgi:hypothetical protein